MRTALASSLNIPAVRTLSLIGVEYFVQKLKESGFKNLKNADYYGHSLALGSADVTLYELVNAYRMLANGGSYSNLKIQNEDVSLTQLQVFSPEAAFIISDILSDREARGYTFSLENPLNTKFRSSVKTGTSKNMRDNWCIGYTNKYTVGVWVGNFSGEAMWNVTGITGAAPVWLSIINYLHKDNIDSKIEYPVSIVKKPVFIDSTDSLARDEWFIKSTEPSFTKNSRYAISLNKKHVIPHIVYPPDGTIITLDPDIPDGIQKIIIEANPLSDEISWVFDGHNTNMNTKIPLIIKPVSGKHTVQLIDKHENILDSVKFEVKGNLKTH